MLAMQYVIPLPDDFDMDRIRQRIRDKGALLDGFDGLLFKAYLYACRGDDGPRNLYAPFYVWRDTAGMDRFLRGPGFAALSADFGRPAVHLWVVADIAVGDDVARPGVTASVGLYDPGPWQSRRFTLWRDEPPPAPRYRVGYVAVG